MLTLTADTEVCDGPSYPHVVVPALPFAPLLSPDRVAGVLAEVGATGRDCVYTPALTLWAFLSQCLCPDGSCRQAVARVLAWLWGRGARAYPADPLADLYRQRWHAELNLRALKGPLGLDVLRCKTPGMVGKEFWARLLAYNLIRGVMAQAALAHGTRPERVGFTGALQTLAACAPWR